MKRSYSLILRPFILRAFILRVFILRAFTLAIVPLGFSILSTATMALSPDLPPSKNFDLSRWSLNIPSDEDENWISDLYLEKELNDGFSHKKYFYTADDGGMVFKTYVGDLTTSAKAKYPRTDLREMLRQGDLKINHKNWNGEPNKNSWVLSSAPKGAQLLAGAVDGSLNAQLAVNHVTQTGNDFQVGSIVIGQIQASKKQPIALYYRKLPNNSHGSIFVRLRDTKGSYYKENIVGGYANPLPNPEDGIKLNEIFSYTIEAKGHNITITIEKDNKQQFSKILDISSNGFDQHNDYMYFTAGLINKNNTGKKGDYAQTTYYSLKVDH